MALDYKRRAIAHAALRPGTAIYREHSWIVTDGGTQHAFPGYAAIHRKGDATVIAIDGHEYRYSANATVLQSPGYSEYYVAPGALRPRWLKGRTPDEVAGGS